MDLRSSSYSSLIDMGAEFRCAHRAANRMINKCLYPGSSHKAGAGAFWLPVAILLFGLSWPAVAATKLQPRFEMNFHFIAQAEVEENPAGMEGDPALKLEVATLDLVVSHPLVLSWKKQRGQRVPARILTSNFTFRKENIEAETEQDIAAFGLEDAASKRVVFSTENFIRVGWKGVYVERFAVGWSLSGIGGGLLSVNDLDRAGPGELALQAGLMLDHSTASGWTLGLGALYNQLTGENAFLPLMHLEKASRSGTLRLALQVPRVALWYRPGQAAVEYGLMGELDGSQYRLLDLEATLYDRQGRVAGEKTDVSLAYSLFKFGPALKLAEVDGLAAFLQLGYAAARRYEFRATDENKTLVLPPDAPVGAGEELDFGVRSSLFVRGHLQYHFGPR